MMLESTLTILLPSLISALESPNKLLLWAACLLVEVILPLGRTLPFFKPFSSLPPFMTLSSVATAPDCFGNCYSELLAVLGTKMVDETTEASALGNSPCWSAATPDLVLMVLGRTPGQASTTAGGLYHPRLYARTECLNWSGRGGLRLEETSRLILDACWVWFRLFCWAAILSPG